MRPEAPIALVIPKVDPYTKQMRSRPYAEFKLQDLGIESIEGYDVRAAPPVRLPDAEPGDMFSVCIASNGVVVVTPTEALEASLLDTPKLVITEWLTLQLISNWPR